MKKLIAVFVALSCAASLTACGAKDGKNAASGCEYPDAKAAAKAVEKPSGKAPKGKQQLTLQTTAGDLELTLDADKAPCTVGAITSLAKQGYYDGTSCHRLTTQGIYVLQCGDPTGKGSGGPGFSFADEYPVGSGEKPVYKAGSIAMANAGPNTNGSQFFLNYQDSPLPPKYTLFGEMTPESLKTLQAIAAKGTKGGTPDGAPADVVAIQKAVVK